MQMNFICVWNSNRHLKEKKDAWSGTNWGILCALKKKIEINEIEIYYPKWIRILRKIIDILIGGDFNLTYKIYSKHKHRNWDNEHENELAFTFGDDVIGVKAKYCCFQDVSAFYVKWMKKNLPEDYKYSLFRGNNWAINLRAKKENEFTQKCYKIFTLGRWLKEFYIKQGYSNQQVIHVGGGINIDVSKRNLTLKQRNKFLFIGRDFYRKGGNLVCKAFKLLYEDNNNLELYVIGPNICPPEAINDGIKFIGNISQKELVYYFNICDVFVMPSYFEAYGLVYIEALTFGLPVIGRNKYEMPYFIENGVTGYLIDSDDPTNLAKKMLDLLSNDEIKNNVIKNTDYYIKNYSWDAVAERIIKSL